MQVAFMIYWLRRILNPEIFQGKYRKDHYFEGWYFKLIDPSNDHALAVIPGISYTREGAGPHAFIQILDARNHRVDYVKYPLSDFHYSENTFEVWIGKNHFSDSSITLDVGEGQARISGTLSFDKLVKYPKTVRKPGIMGPYTFIPRMECYHGIVNIHHEISGSLGISGQEIDFSGGYGYIEKDWGTSFPEAWIWMQSNHFLVGDVSVMFSLAKIPWLGKFFWGFIAFVRIGDRMYDFATYSKARITALEYHGSRLRVTMRDARYTLELDAVQAPGGILKAPKNGMMARDILESIDAEVTVRLASNQGQLIYEGQGSHTGLEVVSDIAAYFEEFPIDVRK
jgi:tocopherol cyclase